MLSSGNFMRERQNGLVASNDYSEQNLFLKLETEAVRLSCIIGNVFPLTAIKTAFSNTVLNWYPKFWSPRKCGEKKD